jgi:hypothetical protein
LTGILSVGTTVAIVTLQGQVGVFEAEVAALTTDVGILTTDVETLNTKTQFQTAYQDETGNPDTKFMSNLLVGTNNSVILSANSGTQSIFEGGLHANSSSNFNGANVENGLQVTGGIVADKVGIDGNKLTMTNVNGLDQINYSSNSTGVRDAGIEFNTDLFNVSGFTDQGTITLRGGTITIGNTDQTGYIYLNGNIVYGAGANINFGGGYFNQGF